MWYLSNESLKINSLYYNFLPSWWHRSYGLTFGERFVFDPDYRVDLYQFMERTVAERFPEFKIGSPDPKPQVIPPDFGNAITPAGAGCEIVYPIDNYPWNHHLDAERVLKLKLPEKIADVFPYREITDQVRYLNKKLDQDCQPVINSRGVLNDAVLIGGSQFFSDFINQTETAQRLLDYAYGILKNTLIHNYRLIGSTGMIILTNCAVMMISPRLFDEHFLAYDRELHSMVTGFGQEFGIHHCGNFERYAPYYRKLPAIHWLEIGWGSDIRTALDLFPEAVIQYIFSAVFVANASAAEVREKTIEILNAARGHWHRFRLSMPDIEYGTPDENLKQIFSVCKEGITNE